MNEKDEYSGLSLPLFSVVVPCYDEPPPLLELLYSRLVDVTETWPGAFEVIVVDDGSPRDTWNALRELHARDDRWRVIRLSRNFGQQAAVSAGLAYAEGDAVMVMDADLQDPPEMLSRFIERWYDGYEVVYAVRTQREDRFLKRFSSWLFYRILSRVARRRIPLDSGDFCLMDRRVVDVLNSLPERNRYVRGLRAWTGFSQAAVEYERSPRHAGESKYDPIRMVRLAVDAVFSFSLLPLRVSTVLGCIVSSVAFVGVVFTLLQRVYADFFARFGLGPVPGFATIVISILFIGGVQLIFLGVIGEYLGRVYDEVKGRPLWVVSDTLGLASRAESSPPPRVRASLEVGP